VFFQVLVVVASIGLVSAGLPGLLPSYSKVQGPAVMIGDAKNPKIVRTQKLLKLALERNVLGCIFCTKEISNFEISKNLSSFSNIYWHFMSALFKIQSYYTFLLKQRHH
jgi:hypothetical protein